jgi:hypothetical protein
MPRISKSKTTDLTETASVVSTPVPVVVVAEPVVKAKKPKATKTDVTVTTTVAPTSSIATVPSVTASSSSVVTHEELVVEDVEASIVAQSVEFMSKLNQLSSMVASLKTEYRTLEKKWSRELKAAQKTSSKKKKRAGNRAPSGFVKPTRISDELAVFLGKDKGSEMARTDVTREINKYIRSHNLQDASNGRKINPDSKLQTLLRLNKTDELTYFNLQRYMSPHFHKADKLLATTA